MQCQSCNASPAIRIEWVPGVTLRKCKWKALFFRCYTQFLSCIRVIVLVESLAYPCVQYQYTNCRTACLAHASPPWVFRIESVLSQIPSNLCAVVQKRGCNVPYRKADLYCTSITAELHATDLVIVVGKQWIIFDWTNSQLSNQNRGRQAVIELLFPTCYCTTRISCCK